jgi:hypothetical protein
MESLNYLNRNVVLTPELKKYGEIYSEFESLYFDKEAKIIEFNTDRTLTVPDLLEYEKTNLVRNLFKECAAKVLKDLESHGIYNVTLKSLLYDSEYYSQFEVTCEQLDKKWNEIISRLEDAKGSQLNKYANNVMSDISGYSWGLITKSVSTMIFYDVMETISVNNQKKSSFEKIKEKTKKLDEKYGHLAYERGSELLRTYFYPTILELIKSYIHALRKDYMNILEERGIFNFSQLNIDEEFSEAIIENLPYVEDKIRILDLAFNAFPFNADLYRSIISLDLMTEELTEFLHTFQLEQPLKVSCYNYILQGTLNDSSVEKIVDFYLQHYAVGQDKVTFLSSSIYIKIVLFYQNFLKIFVDDEYAANWIHSVVGVYKINYIKLFEVTDICTEYVESVKKYSNYQKFTEVIPFDAETYIPEDLIPSSKGVTTWENYNEFLILNLRRFIWNIIFEYQLEAGSSNQFNFSLLQTKARSELNKFKGVSLNQSEENTAKANVKTEPKKPETKKTEKKPEKKNPWFR